MADQLSLSQLGSVMPEPVEAQSLANLGRYGPRTLPSNYNTKLPPLEEMQFRQWLSENHVPFNADAALTDYDMRGFYQASRQGQPGVSTQVNPNDNLLHYPDRFKTPIHRSFSNESQWAGASAPQWINDSQLASPNGRIVFDERR